VVRIAPTSEPAPGSDIDTDIFTSPERMRGIQYARCASLPLRATFSPQNTQLL